jgi:hypothetical protein
MVSGAFWVELVGFSGDVVIPLVISRQEKRGLNHRPRIIGTQHRFLYIEGCTATTRLDAE